MKILWYHLRPRFLLWLIFSKSSMNPMSENAIATKKDEKSLKFST